jgi:hypothetical protein
MALKNHFSGSVGSKLFSSSSSEVESAEVVAIRLGNDRKALLRRLMDAKSTLVSSIRESFGKGRFDFKNKRLISDDGRYILAWRLRAQPDRPISYYNQQTTGGSVFLEEPKTPIKPADRSAAAVRAAKTRAANEKRRAEMGPVIPIKKTLEELKATETEVLGLLEQIGCLSEDGNVLVPLGYAKKSDVYRAYESLKLELSKVRSDIYDVVQLHGMLDSIIEEAVAIKNRTIRLRSNGMLGYRMEKMYALAKSMKMELPTNHPMSEWRLG